nr:MAG TPA: hypothetical protein [Caudoviricetes sp.]
MYHYAFTFLLPNGYLVTTSQVHLSLKKPPRRL